MSEFVINVVQDPSIIIDVNNSDQTTSLNIVQDQPNSITIEDDVNNVLLNPSVFYNGINIVYLSGVSGELLHNTFGDLQGGTTGQYYHLSSGQYFNLTTGSVVRPSETGAFYPASNPSGFITGVNLSGYLTGINDIIYTTGDQIKSGRLIIGNDSGSIVNPNSEYTLSLQTNSPATWLEILNYSGANQGVFFGIQDNNLEQYNWQGGHIKFFTSENPSDGFERLIIKNDGKVGIGTNSPSEKLEVSGNIKSNTAYFNNRPTVNGTGVLLSGEAYPLNNPSGYITGSVVRPSDTGNFITTSQTGAFYASSNPSGFITGVDLSFSGNYYTKSESESRYVNTTGAETILGDKTFHDKVYINNLYVTGLETIVNTTNTNVASNYIMLNLTGGAVDGGLFFVTGSGLTGVNDSGAILGFDHSDKFKFGIGTRASDLSVLSTIASFEEVTGISGNLQTQISTLSNQTGNYVLNTQTGNFITTAQTGQFYSSSNPSGYVTGAVVRPSETGVFITQSQTGQFYPISNPSGFITGLDQVSFLTLLPTGIEETGISFPYSFAATPKVLVNLQLNSDTGYLVGVKNVAVTGYRAIFSDVLTETGIYLHTFATQ